MERKVHLDYVFIHLKVPNKESGLHSEKYCQYFVKLHRQMTYWKSIASFFKTSIIFMKNKVKKPKIQSFKNSCNLNKCYRPLKIRITWVLLYVCIHIYTYKYIYTHTQTHTYIYITHIIYIKYIICNIYDIYIYIILIIDYKLILVILIITYKYINS